MEERVTLLHRTHVFAALYCVTCVVCNFDNVCLITCLQPQLIPCRQNDARDALPILVPFELREKCMP
jgi:hypothetical protein